MDIAKVQKLIAQGESKTIEYKKSIAELEKLGQSICGFLNSVSGYGFIGITDDKKIIGIEVNDSTKKKLTVFCDYFDPEPKLEIEYIPIPNTDKQIVAILASYKKKQGPFTFKSRPYQKTESGMKIMPYETFTRLLLDRAGFSKTWEALPSENFSIDDLDHDEIIKTMKLGMAEGRVDPENYSENVKDILTSFDLIHGDFLTNAAVVLFAKKIPMNYAQCFIRMGRFTDETLDEAIDSRQIRGNAISLIDEGMNFIRRNLPISSRYSPDSIERIDKAALPILAVREALINAVCHRDYSKPSGDISILIFNDYLEIHNAGHLYGGLTVEQLSKVHPSRRRNERIAQVFYSRKLIERFGGGTRRIFKLCKEEQLPEPVFEEKADGLSVKFYFKETIAPTKLDIVSQDIIEKLDSQQREVVSILQERGELSTSEIRSLMQKSPAERTMRDILAKLKKIGVIETRGQTTQKKWYLIEK